MVYVEPMKQASKLVSEKARRDAAALVRKGNALIERGAAGEAVAAFRRALELVPGHAEAGFNLGAALAEAGRSGEAEAAFRRLIAGKPDVARAHAALARALDAHRIGRFESGMRLVATDAPETHWTRRSPVIARPWRRCRCSTAATRRWARSV